MSETVWERAEAAMRAKRMELIAKPIDRIYGELLRVGFGILADDLVKHLESKADAAEANAALYRARANDPDDSLAPDDCIELADGWETDAFHHGYNAQEIRLRAQMMAIVANIPVMEV